MALDLFIDSADPSDWSRWLQSGVFKGITTNPTLLKRAKQPCTPYNLQELAKKAADLGCKQLHLQAWGKSTQEIINCGLTLSEYATNCMEICIKIPLTLKGNIAAKQLINQNIPITLTASYRVKQAIIATSLGAKYIAPYLGRISNTGRNGLEEIIHMQKILSSSSSKCKILAASIKSIEELTTLAENGISTFAINANLINNLFECKESLEDEKTFYKDACE